MTTTHAKDEPLLDVGEAAAHFHVSRQTIYRQIRRGQIPAVKVGSQWRIPRLPLDQWKRNQ